MLNSQWILKDTVATSSGTRFNVWTSCWARLSSISATRSCTLLLLRFGGGQLVGWKCVFWRKPHPQLLAGPTTDTAPVQTHTGSALHTPQIYGP